MSTSVSNAGTSGPTRYHPDLSRYIEVSLRSFDTCISEVSHSISTSAPQATIHLQYVKFDPHTGQPKFDLLAKVLANHIVRYTLSIPTREHMKQLRLAEEEDEGELARRARDYFRKLQTSGEVGELLLFFLLEAAFAAPQVVCKMELKTNSNDEVKGCDGIHVKWDPNGSHLDVYLGESKLHQSLSGAIGSVFRGLAKFYELGRLDDELHLVTAHFKHLNDDLKSTLTSYLKRETSDGRCHIIHACLIGWDWERYKLLASAKRDQVIRQFEQEYLAYAGGIQKMLDERFAKSGQAHLSFKFLFLPFLSVGEFRRQFYKVLCGVDLGPSDS